LPPIDARQALLSRARATLFHSIGSCSFFEPHELGIL